MVNEEGKVVRIIDNEEEPSEEIIDKKTGKKIHKPKKKKIINEDGEVEDVEEIVEDIQSEYDEETGKKLPKKKKYKTKDGKEVQVIEDEESEYDEKTGEKKPKKKKIINKDDGGGLTFKNEENNIKKNNIHINNNFF